MVLDLLCGTFFLTGLVVLMTEGGETLLTPASFHQIPLFLLKHEDTGNKTHRSHSLYDYIVPNLPGQPALLSDLWEPPLVLLL